MPERSYSTFGGPCHWDLLVCLYVFITPRYVRSTVGRRPSDKRLRREIRKVIKRLTKRTDAFFNPFKRRQGIYTLYTFPPCCNFHLDVEFRSPPRNWSGLNVRQVEALLPAGCGIILVDDLGLKEHPYARIGGRRLLFDGGNRNTSMRDKYVLAHEIGHLLGLPDHYRTPTIPGVVQGNGMSRAEERAHRGHLMGRKRRGRRAIQPHEMQDIAQLTGMRCDRAICCPEDTGGGLYLKPVNDRTGFDNGCFFDSRRGAVASFDFARETFAPVFYSSLLVKRGKPARSDRSLPG